MYNSLYLPLIFFCPHGSEGKESACSAGDPGSIPELGRSSGGGHSNPLQYSCLESPMDRGAWWATVHVVAEWEMTKQLTLSLFWAFDIKTWCLDSCNSSVYTHTALFGFINPTWVHLSLSLYVRCILSSQGVWITVSWRTCKNEDSWTCLPGFWLSRHLHL